MEFYADTSDFDLITPDGKIVTLEKVDDDHAIARVVIENIPPQFVGFKIDPELVVFNSKSTLAQLGVDARAKEIVLDKKNCRAEILLKLVSIGSVGKEMLRLIDVGAYVGKLFAMDDRRRVRDPYYLSRMFGRSDRWGSPLLSLGGYQGGGDLILDKFEGRCVAYLTLKNGTVKYDSSIYGLLPTVSAALKQHIGMRELLHLHQVENEKGYRNVKEGELLLVKTSPLHVRTVFAKVADELLTPGFSHTSASVLEPATQASGDIYELYGESEREISDIPLEFYTLEPYREFVFFSDRDQLQASIDDPEKLFAAFETAPEPIEDRASVLIVKGDQLQNLSAKDWIIRETHFHEFPGQNSLARQQMMVERYIEQQPSYPFLKNIEDGVITSEGILLTRYFPSPLMKRMLLSDQVQKCLKGLYFYSPSKSNIAFFSHEDRAFLHDLDVFGIPVFWVDEATRQILRYIQKEGRDSGMFVPLDKVDTFLDATMFGIYGSNLLSGDFESELKVLLESVLAMRSRMNHSLLTKDTPIALVTGGGPGAMEVGNKIAKDLGILSCANIVDFRAKPDAVVNEQKQNPYVEAKMTYRLDRLVERQAEFNLDFPIFVMGGIGTDFEFYLEQVRRKVGAVETTPILLFGSEEYWEEKITTNFQCNRKSGTISGSEWISNCFYVVDNAKAAAKVYEQFFTHTLPIGPNGPVFDKGFSVVH